jgi:hypothetical protein
MVEKILITVLICWVVMNCGVLFEHRAWVRWAEWIRIVLYPLILVFITYYYKLPNNFYLLAAAYFIVSASWFYLIQKNDPTLQFA